MRAVSGPGDDRFRALCGPEGTAAEPSGGENAPCWPAAMAGEAHPVPSRTRKLSPLAPMVLRCSPWESRTPPASKGRSPFYRPRGRPPAASAAGGLLLCAGGPSPAPVGPALPLLPAPRATEVADSARGARRRPLCGRACNASTRAWPERLGARPGEGARVGKRPDSADYGSAPRVSLAPSVTGGAGRPAEYVGTVNAGSALDTARRGAYINSSRSNARRRETAARRGRARDLENRILRSRDRRRRQTSEVESSLGMS